MAARGPETGRHAGRAALTAGGLPLMVKLRGRVPRRIRPAGSGKNAAMPAPRFAMPFFLPVFAFAAAIGAGAFLLGLDVFTTRPVRPVDALFLATSAVCVTGLAPFDIFAVYTRPGQCIVLALVQLGGIGIFTYATLFVHLMGRRISLTDRVAVEQGLFYDHGFSLSAFVRRVVVLVFVIEAAGALCLLALGEEEIGPFNAVFLSVSAFCNAGFAPWGDSLERFRGAFGLNGILMALIVLGGLGFFVLDDLLRRLRHGLGRRFGPARRLPQPENAAPRLSWCSRLVLRTTFWLIVAGGLGIFALEWRNPAFAGLPVHERLLAAFFESVTCRTAGFDTVNQASFSTASLFLAALLMGIGGSPGSCAGGIKTTTFRVVLAQLRARLTGRPQAVLQGRGLADATISQAFLLFFCATFIILAASFAILLLERGATPHTASAQFFDIAYEVVSAFCTVGLSLNLTPRLGEASKLVLCCAMFIGKLGPIWLIGAVSQLTAPQAFRYPEETLPVG